MTNPLLARRGHRGIRGGTSTVSEAISGHFGMIGGGALSGAGYDTGGSDSGSDGENYGGGGMSGGAAA